MATSYYSPVSKTLNDKGIIRDIKIAGEYYKRGDIVRCYDILSGIAAAIKSKVRSDIKEGK